MTYRVSPITAAPPLTETPGIRGRDVGRPVTGGHTVSHGAAVDHTGAAVKNGENPAPAPIKGEGETQ